MVIVVNVLKSKSVENSLFFRKKFSKSINFPKIENLPRTFIRHFRVVEVCGIYFDQILSSHCHRPPTIFKVNLSEIANPANSAANFDGINANRVTHPTKMT